MTLPTFLLTTWKRTDCQRYRFGQVVLGDLADLLVQRVLLGRVELDASVLEQLVDLRVVVVVGLATPLLPAGYAPAGVEVVVAAVTGRAVGRAPERDGALAVLVVVLLPGDVLDRLRLDRQAEVGLPVLGDGRHDVGRQRVGVVRVERELAQLRRGRRRPSRAAPWPWPGRTASARRCRVRFGRPYRHGTMFAAPP